MPSEPDDWDQREIAAFDWADRWNGFFLRGLGVGLPAFVMLLLVLGWAGAGALTGFVVACLLSTILFALLETLLFRRMPPVRRRRVVATIAWLAGAFLLALVVAAGIRSYYFGPDPHD